MNLVNFSNWYCSKWQENCDTIWGSVVPTWLFVVIAILGVIFWVVFSTVADKYFMWTEREDETFGFLCGSLSWAILTSTLYFKFVSYVLLSPFALGLLWIAYLITRYLTGGTWMLLKRLRKYKKAKSISPIPEAEVVDRKKE